MVHGLFDWDEVYCEGVGMTEWRFGFFRSRFSCTGTVSTPGMCQTGAKAWSLHNHQNARTANSHS